MSDAGRPAALVRRRIGSAPRARGAALGAAGFVLACTFAPGGLLSALHADDVPRYAEIAGRVVHGAVPYRDFYLEYPPGSLAAFLVPRVPWISYGLAFKLSIVVLGALAFWAMWRYRFGRGTGISSRAAVAAVALWVAVPLVAWRVVLDGYDLWPAALTAAALVLALDEHEAAAGVACGLGFAAKLYPALILPALGVWVARRRGRAELRRLLGAFGLTSACAFVPFVVLAPGGVGFSLESQLVRHLQIESLGGSALLAAGKLGLYRPVVAEGFPNASVVLGRPAAILTVAGLVLVCAALLLAVAAYASGPDEPDRLAAAAAASVLAFVVFGKVLSPQYLSWLLPLVPLVRGRRGAAAAVLFAAAAILTQVETSNGDRLAALGWPVWVLLARNLLLVLLLGTLLAALRPRRGPAHDSVTGHF